MLAIRFIVMSLIPLTFFLAACGGSDSPTAVPTAADNADPDSADAPQLSAIGDGTFEFTVSGTQDASISSGQGVVVRDPGMEVSGMTLPAHTEIMLTSGSMTSEMYLVLIAIPPDTDTGTYELTEIGFDESGFTAEYNYLNMEDMESSLDFAWNVSGTLTLTQVGDHYSGTFEFSAGGGFEDTDGSVNVSGSFDNLEAYDAEYDDE
jgi:hypothetical protein